MIRMMMKVITKTDDDNGNDSSKNNQKARTKPFYESQLRKQRKAKTIDEENSTTHPSFPKEEKTKI